MREEKGQTKYHMYSKQEEKKVDQYSSSRKSEGNEIGFCYFINFIFISNYFFFNLMNFLQDHQRLQRHAD